MISIENSESDNPAGYGPGKVDEQHLTLQAASFQFLLHFLVRG